jgi:hypothetical protein
MYPIIFVTFGLAFVQALRRKIGWKVALPFASHQSCGKPRLHADRVWAAKSAVGVNRHPGRLEHDHVDDAGDLAALPLGRCGTGALFRVGVDRHGSPTVDHVEQLRGRDDGN